MNIGDFIKNTFAYKQFFFIILATISLFSNGIKYLGSNSIVGIVLAIAFAYFMGFYTNEMPTSTDGFSKKIREDIIQLSVEKINKSNPKLVKICEPIPIDETKIENKITNRQYRELTKHKEVGGQINKQPTTLMNISENNMNQPIQSQLQPIQQLQSLQPPIQQSPIQSFQNGGKKGKKSKKYNIRFV
jgi:hypothetical protein